MGGISVFFFNPQERKKLKYGNKRIVQSMRKNYILKNKITIKIFLESSQSVSEKYKGGW